MVLELLKDIIEKKLAEPKQLTAIVDGLVDKIGRYFFVSASNKTSAVFPGLTEVIKARVESAYED